MTTTTVKCNDLTAEKVIVTVVVGGYRSNIGKYLLPISVYPSMNQKSN